MEAKVKHFFLLMVLYFLTIGAAPNIPAEIFVHSVNGNPTLSMDGYFNNIPIEVGMFIHPSMKAQVSHSHNFRVHCGDPNEPIKIINTKQVSALCRRKRTTNVMRSESDSSYPIIISPRKPNVVALEQIEWAHSSTSMHKLTISEFGDNSKPPIEVLLNPKKRNSRYSTQYYHLSNHQKSILEHGKKYSIVIKDLNTGSSSEKDPGFSGVIQLVAHAEIKDINNSLKKVTQTLNNETLDRYFSAIHLRNQEYYADSTRMLSKANASLNPLHLHYLQVKNAQLEGVQTNYLTKKWMDLLVAAVKKENTVTAALACMEIRSGYGDLPTYWHDFLGKYKNHDKFRQYCDLSDL